MDFLNIILRIYVLVFFCTANNSNDSDNKHMPIPDDKELEEMRKVHKNITSNWTSCDEFLANTTLDVKTLVDIDWQIFYFWDYKDVESYNIRFSIPTSILVDRFQVGLKDKHHNVNWSRAALFMESTIDFSALFISTDTPGKFQIIPSFIFEMNHLPTLMFGLKFVEPVTLGIMNCEHRFCYALAPSDRLPERDTIKLEAEKLGFRGDANYSYLEVKNSPYVFDPTEVDENDDAEDEEEFEIENRLDEL